MYTHSIYTPTWPSTYSPPHTYFLSVTSWSPVLILSFFHSPAGNHFSILCIYVFFFSLVYPLSLFLLVYIKLEWNHMVSVFLHLIYFTHYNTLRVHSCCCYKCQGFIFLWLSTIHFIYTCMHTYTYIYTYIHVYVPLFFIRLSIDKNIGFFQVLAIVNKPLWTWGWSYLWGLLFPHSFSTQKLSYWII